MSEQIGFRVTPEEKKMIEDWAADWSISPQELLRTCLYDNEYAEEHGLRWQDLD